MFPSCHSCLVISELAAILTCHWFHHSTDPVPHVDIYWLEAGANSLHVGLDFPCQSCFTMKEHLVWRLFLSSKLRVVMMPTLSSLATHNGAISGMSNWHHHNYWFSFWYSALSCIPFSQQNLAYPKIITSLTKILHFSIQIMIYWRKLKSTSWLAVSLAQGCLVMKHVKPWNSKKIFFSDQYSAFIFDMLLAISCDVLGAYSMTSFPSYYVCQKFTILVKNMKSFGRLYRLLNAKES